MNCFKNNVVSAKKNHLPYFSVIILLKLKKSRKTKGKTVYSFIIFMEMLLKMKRKFDK